MPDQNTLLLILFAAFFLLAFVPHASNWLGVTTPVEITSIKGLGWFCLVVSLLDMVIAQAQMGASWRIGIDSANRTELVSKGLFSISRNPIFLAVRLALLGFFLVAPNAATLALLAAAEVIIQVQVRLEEKHLLGLHGATYEQYFSKVPRWL